MQSLHDLPIRRGTLLLVRNWLDEHSEAIKRDFRSAKQIDFENIADYYISAKRDEDD